MSSQTLVLGEEQKNEKTIKKLELKDTVKGMISSDYKERFVEEYQQTKIRYEKLKHFCNLIELAKKYGYPEPKHDCPYELLREQQAQMGAYLHTLELRAIVENIDLGNI